MKMLTTLFLLLIGSSISLQDSPKNLTNFTVTNSKCKPTVIKIVVESNLPTTSQATRKLRAYEGASITIKCKTNCSSNSTKLAKLNDKFDSESLFKVNELNSSHAGRYACYHDEGDRLLFEYLDLIVTQNATNATNFATSTTTQPKREENRQFYNEEDIQFSYILEERQLFCWSNQENVRLNKLVNVFGSIVKIAMNSSGSDNYVYDSLPDTFSHGVFECSVGRVDEEQKFYLAIQDQTTRVVSSDQINSTFAAYELPFEEYNETQDDQQQVAEEQQSRMDNYSSPSKLEINFSCNREGNMVKLDCSIAASQAGQANEQILIRKFNGEMVLSKNDSSSLQGNVRRTELAGFSSLLCFALNENAYGMSICQI